MRLAIAKGCRSKKGSEMLDRWDRLWQPANDFAAPGPCELSRTSAFRRWATSSGQCTHSAHECSKGVLKMVDHTKPQILVPALRGPAL